MPEIPAPTGRSTTIDDVARSVVARVAPDEIDAYPRVRDEYFVRGRANRSEDNPLGFGEIVVGVVTGIVLTVLHDLAVESLTDAARPWWKRGWQRIGQLLRVRRRPKVEPGTVARAPSPEQVPAVIASVNDHVRKAGLPPQQAELLAQAIIAELTSPERPDDGACADSSG
ncbi:MULTISPECIES: hypothetical protein [Nocardiopsidaceae]|uniref:Uncharacterized protein n=2 Tax=Nocardiopsidaceae TaxID=83676 RepID=A0ABY6YU10_9ACTN|nr:hypothetical protein [Streptomonospora nanhaiensis]MEE2042262.1 hypothetical protein [Nocardiopsis tropica]WAE75591.1 hypothetical protein OUQ99_11130 [Streptomonospora nanhaiensis]